MTREIFEPAKPAYYTVIPSAHCPKGTETRYVTAPLQATPDGSPVYVAPKNVAPTEVTKSQEQGETIQGFANIVVKENLTYEEYQRAIQLLAQIEDGTHHVIDQGAEDVLHTEGNYSATGITYHNEIKSEESPGGMFHPLLVDIEKELRVQRVDPQGRPVPPVDTKVGFVPLGGQSGSPVSPTSPLPESDPTRIVDAEKSASNRPAIVSQTSFTAPRDMINKYVTYAQDGRVTGSPTNGDKTVISNDTVLFETPGQTPTTVQDTPTVPRDAGPVTTSFK